MKSFIIFVMVIEAIAILFRVYYISDDNYPRMEKVTSAADVINLLFAIAVFGWGWSLLY